MITASVLTKVLDGRTSSCLIVSVVFYQNISTKWILYNVIVTSKYYIEDELPLHSILT